MSWVWAIIAIGLLPLVSTDWVDATEYVTERWVEIEKHCCGMSVYIEDGAEEADNAYT